MLDISLDIKIKPPGLALPDLGVRGASPGDKLVKTELGSFYFICNPNHLTKLRAR